MPEGTFVTVCGFSGYRGIDPFNIGARFMCQKEPNNPHDDEAIRVMDESGVTIGYLANGGSTRANGTLSASRVYDRVGSSLSSRSGLPQGQKSSVKLSILMLWKV